MKTKIFRTITLAICALVFSFTANAQFPNFTKIDTGAITVLPGGHVSSACFDMDNDGDLDVLNGNTGMGITRDFSIYKNERNGFFVKIPKFVYYDNAENLYSIGDFDNDGDMDLFAGNMKDLKLYTNDGFGNYQFDKAISLVYTTMYPSSIDLNNDGFLDIIGIDRNGGVFYNDGNGGFLGYEILGLIHEPPEILLHGMSWGDCDDDGDMDFYGGYSYKGGEGGHVSKNACVLNNGDGTFVKFDETSVIVDDSTSENGCINWVDYDNDGDMDLYVVNLTLDSIDGPLSALYENLGAMQFIKHIFEDEMYRNSFKTSSVWGDLDNDADLDLYVSVENNEIPWPIYYTSATPFNLLFLNEGDGSFTNILDHPLAIEDSHTAIMFDHDNDGDLDVLLTRYSWSNDGHCNLLENEGNDNSWLVLLCEGTVSNRSAIGTRIYAKCFVNGKHITQTREITPINGHATYANLRIHFGLGDTDKIDTLIVRWPSGDVDEYLDVKANHFYKAIEDDDLYIDFAATNYIQYNPAIPDVVFETEGELLSINLSEHYLFIKGDTVPAIIGDTLVFDSIYIENTNIVTASINSNILTLESGTENGESEIQVFLDAGFTKRMDRFTVSRLVGINTISVENKLQIFPNPFSTSTTIEYELIQPEIVTLTIYDYLGKQLYQTQENQSQGKQQLIWHAEELQAGIYFCVLKTNQGTQTTKLIKL